MVLIAEIFSQDYRSNPQRGFSLAFVARSPRFAKSCPPACRQAGSLLEPRFEKNFPRYGEKYHYLETNGNNPK